VLELSDRITVMRKGKKIATVAASETNKEALAQMMVGRQVHLHLEAESASARRSACSRRKG
jgi:simple sugar transport system ATP-binding protein